MAVNRTTISPEFLSDDATWILTSAFIVFTMQSGFGLLEAGMVNAKNEANIMVKNAVDVVFGGLAFWLFGYGLSFGENGNAFIGSGSFLLDSDEEHMGQAFSKYFFQLSFSTTATTIVSGAMAERTKLRSYMVYSFLNVLIYSFPTHWIWSDQGFLAQMGAVDIAGGAPVHVVGGVSSLIATLILKPRHGRFNTTERRPMASPPSVVLGTFMLWWGWLGFNCGSTFGISGHKWKFASRAAVNTINSSIGGALFGIVYSYSRKKFKGQLYIPVFTTGILGGLVAVTAICTICRPWEALLIGTIGGALAVIGDEMLTFLKIDDPVSCIPTHLFSGSWSVISVSLFAERDNMNDYQRHYGVLKGGPWRLVGVQLMTVVVVMVWTALTTTVLLLGIDCVMGLRMNLEDELIGADISEHDIRKGNLFDFLPDIKNALHVSESNPKLSRNRRNVSYCCNVSFRRAAQPINEGADHVVDIKGGEDNLGLEMENAARNVAILLKHSDGNKKAIEQF